MINKNFKKVNKLISFIDTKILLILSIVTIVSLFVLKISWAGCSVSNYNVTISDSGPSAHSYIAHSNITLEGGTNGCNLWEAWFNGYSSPSSDWKYGCMEQKSFSGFAATICKGLSYGPTCYGSCQCSSDGRIWKGGCYEPGEEITFTLTDLSGMHIGTVPINITAIAYIPGAEKICYQDADNDGYGNPVSSQKFNGGSCPSGWVSDNTDCDDTNENIDDTSPRLR